MQYEAWVREVKLWSLCCKLEKKEQGPALALSLSGHAQQAAMDIDTDMVNSDHGLQAVINKLNGLYLKDVNQRIYVALKHFECYKRSPETSMDDFLNQFDLRYNRLRAHGIVLPDVILGYRMIESANLSQSRNELVRISAGAMNYDEIKKQLRKLEDIAASSSFLDADEIKTEDALFQYNDNSNRGGYNSRARGGHVACGAACSAARGGAQSRGGNGATRSWHATNRGCGANRRGGRRRGRGRGACFICGEYDHWSRECPQGEYGGGEDEEGEVEDAEVVEVEI